MADRLTLFFEPLDVLLFRDYRPFDAGLAVLGQSRLPLPTVFLGCVRGALFRQLGADFDNRDAHYGIREGWERTLLGSRTMRGTLGLRGPLLAFRDGDGVHPLFEPPRDLAVIHDGGAQREHILTCCIGQRMSRRGLDETSRPLALRLGAGRAEPASDTLPWWTNEPKKDRPGLLTVAGARRYLNGSDGASLELLRYRAGGAPLDPAMLRQIHTVDQNAIIDAENRFGITQAPETRVAEEHMFYLARPYRLAPGAGFAVEVDLAASCAATAGQEGFPVDGVKQLLKQLDGQAVPLGGRGHRAQVHVHEGAIEGLAPDLEQAPGAKKIWLLTPAIVNENVSKQGAWPGGMVGCVAERTMAVGGFDMAQGAPRALQRALPAGSVLYLDKGTPARILEEIGNTEEHRRAGFGLALVK
jgi:CRISPR/Cas system CMR-associated protein Cmr3 (group 5 of RAMP superfamily)